MKNNILKFYCTVLICAIGVWSCTDLEIEETDSIINEGFQGVANAASAVEAIYNDMNGHYSTQENLYSLSEVTSDAAIIPTRGGDWGDNGRWTQLHQHLWTPEHQFVIGTWDQWNRNQLLASQVLDPRSNPTSKDIGEASFLRALSMWNILDLYGQVPYRDVSLPSSSLPEILTGQSAVDFIISDIDTAITNIPEIQAGDFTPEVGLEKAGKAAARFLKAKILLNKHIYLGNESPDSNDMSTVISLVDQITEDGFELQDGYFDIFRETADSETIWYRKSDVGPRIHNGLHYNSLTQEGGGWNGFATLAEYYDLFEGDPQSNRIDINGNPLDGQEERRGGVPPAGVNELVDSQVGNGFLIGQQYSNEGEALNDRAGAPLTFKKQFLDISGNSNIINNDETTGIRVIKYSPQYGSRNQHMVIFRYADAYLMKAEAMFRSGGDPTDMINELREIRNADPLSNVTEQDIIDERGRELFAEGWRRNDLIRFDRYLRDWQFKAPGSIDNDQYKLFPIPDSQLLANPNLVQNPGY